MDKFISTVKAPIKRALKLLNFKEHWKIASLKRQQRLFQLEELTPYFKDHSFFAFATGGSLSNLKNLERLHNKNILMLTTGIVHFYRLYNVMPNMWFVHNPDSVEMTINEMEKYNLKDKMSFEETFILVPSNKSDGKIHFSSPVFKKFRNYISEKASFVLYEEELRPFSPATPPKDYLKPGRKPIQRLDGSSVENIFLPYLHFLGIKEIYFSGVDHLEHTGHFWDRNHAYQTMDQQLLKFEDIIPNDAIQQCSEVALKKCQEYDIRICRLEKEETRMKKYPFATLESALQRTSRKITPKDIFR
jgi:hypothetical protein